MRTLAAALCLWAWFVLCAQDAKPPRRHFEVASVKPNLSGKRALQSYAYSPGGGLSAINATLVDMIVRVYPTRRIQMRGGPEWIDSERFDVFAKADAGEGEIKPGQWQEMVQTLLEDRFQLRFHTEMHEMQVLALLPGKSAAKLDAPREGEQTALTPGEHGQMMFHRMNMQGLVNTMSNILQTPVVDRTGLAGYYDFTLDPNQFAAADSADGLARRDDFGQLVTAAVEKQLGFRLEKQKAPLEITVIDRAEKPTEN